jgi:hypothetical protein
MLEEQVAPARLVCQGMGENVQPVHEREVHVSRELQKSKKAVLIAQVSDRVHASTFMCRAAGKSVQAAAVLQTDQITKLSRKC